MSERMRCVDSKEQVKARFVCREDRVQCVSGIGKSLPKPFNFSIYVFKYRLQNDGTELSGDSGFESRAGFSTAIS